MPAGCVALAAGAAVTVLGVAASVVGLFLLGTAMSGAGFGTAFLGAFRTLAIVAIGATARIISRQGAPDA
jgi:hypothetical protein